MAIVIRREEDNIEGLTFKFPLGDHVKYQNQLWRIFKHENKNGEPAYLLDLLSDDTTYIDLVLETDIEDCDMKCACCFEFIEETWERFVYNGDNSEASKWLMNNLIRKLHGVKHVDFGHNQANTEYYMHIKHNDEEYNWTKSKTN